MSVDDQLCRTTLEIALQTSTAATAEESAGYMNEMVHIILIFAKQFF